MWWWNAHEAPRRGHGPQSVVENWILIRSGWCLRLIAVQLLLVFRMSGRSLVGVPNRAQTGSHRGQRGNEPATECLQTQDQPLQSQSEPRCWLTPERSPSLHRQNALLVTDQPETAPPECVPSSPHLGWRAGV